MQLPAPPFPADHLLLFCRLSLYHEGYLSSWSSWVACYPVLSDKLLEGQIAQIKSAAVFVGKDGFGPWQRRELDAFLREFADRGCPVIPVLLPDVSQEPQLPIFLRGMTW